MPTRPKTHNTKRFKTHDLPTLRHHAAILRAKKIRSSATWRKVRLMKLSRNPMCEDPVNIHKDIGEVVVADQVHHLKKISTHPELAFTLDNLMSICRHCHEKIEDDDE